MNIRLIIEYDGSLYCGWQIQPRDISIQGEIEKALSTILKKRIRIIGAGRTDSGVHAGGQVANFKTDSLPITLVMLKRSLNGILKQGITIKQVTRVDNGFHARYSAKWRTYVYSISKRKRSIDRNQYYCMPFTVNVPRMKQAAGKMKGKHDFRNLSVAKGEKSTLCDLKRLIISENKDEILFTFTADRYLHKMVRMCVGLLIDIGRGKIPMKYLDNIFKKQSIKRKEGFCAPAQGLCLVKVEY
jgi:tRNA pseudouridine38-40 synthase